MKSIAASTAQNDSGMFETAFQDSRYLTFEGAGVISSWSLELFNDNSEDFGRSLRQFDYSTVTDAILHALLLAGPLISTTFAYSRLCTDPSANVMVIVALRSGGSTAICVPSGSLIMK